MDINDFNFDNITNEKGDVFEDEKKSYVDERFYTLPKKADGSGSAVIAFIPDMHKTPMIRMFKINTTIVDGKQKRWCNAWSPKSIGKDCPFQETYINHYDEDSDLAIKFKPKERWVCNIKVIKDSEKPENVGKIFLYEMSKTMAEKIKNTLTLSKEEIEMGAERKEIFNPFKGWVFTLKCSKGDNGFTTYDSSSFTQLPGGRTIYNLDGEFTEESKKAGIDDILNKTYDLSEFKKEENFMSYDELYKELEKVCSGIFGIGTKKKSKPQNNSDEISINDANQEPKAEVKSAEVKTETKHEDSTNLDDFLKDLG